MAKDIDISDEWSDEDYDDFERASLEDLANNKDCAWEPCGDEHCEGCDVCDADVYEEDFTNTEEFYQYPSDAKHTLYSIDDSPFGTAKSSIELSVEDMAVLLNHLKNPPKPNDALKKAQKRYRATVIDEKVTQGLKEAKEGKISLRKFYYPRDTVTGSQEVDRAKSEALMNSSHCLFGECPCDHTPNAETIQAMKDAAEGKTESISDMDEYFKSLDAEDYGDDTTYLLRSETNRLRLQASFYAHDALKAKNKRTESSTTRTLALALGVCTLGMASIMASVLMVFS